MRTLPPRIRWSRSQGFTLAELAVAFAIILLLLGGLLLPLSSQYELSKIRDTEQVLERIHEALLGFVVTQGRLPCPAVPQAVLGAATPPPAAGVEAATAGVCDTNNAGTSTGVIPWITLGVPETDAWGRRFTYSVTSTFADWLPAAGAQCPSTNPNRSSFCTTQVGNIALSTKVQAGPPIPVGNQFVAVVVSHGPNGLGGYQNSGVQIPVGGIGADENTNVAAALGAAPWVGPKAAYIRRDSLRTTAACNDAAAGNSLCTFDDLVVTIDAGLLVNKMVAAGRLP